MNTNVTSRAGQGTELAVAGRRVMTAKQTLIDRLVLYAPLALLPLLAFAFRNKLPAWGFMWLLAFAIFLGCKWLTWQQCRAAVAAPQWKNWAYFLGWPGLDAKAFLSQGRPVTPPSPVEWAAAVAKTALGATLLWGVLPKWPAPPPLLAGWCGLFGLVFLLHFGSFHLLALVWRGFGIDARPLMEAPVRATSLGEFWGRCWNSAFNKLVHDALFRPFYRRLGTTWATMGVFLASGFIHELVISVPARAGYGLPTLYFVLQGFGVIAERARAGRRLGLRHGAAGRCFTLIFTAAPAFWLFHPPFIQNVILPMLHAIGALPNL